MSKDCCQKDEGRVAKATGFLSLLLYFIYPKCPACWAVYTSGLSLIGAGEIAYNSYIITLALIVFLLSALFSIYKFLKSENKLGMALYLSGLLTVTLSFAFEIETFMVLSCVLFMSSLLSCRYIKVSAEV